ncbi:MAG: glycosyltransferase family 39 protein [Oscillospiraceae bacterium]
MSETENKIMFREEGEMVEFIVLAFLLVSAAMLAVRCLSAVGLKIAFPEKINALGFKGGIQRRFSMGDTGKVFCCAFLFRFVIFAAAFLCIFLNSSAKITMEEAVSQFVRWDAYHYIQLVEKGYAGYTENGQPLFLVFFPLYVWMVRLVKLIIPSTLLAGVFLSFLSYSWGCCWVYKLAVKLYNKKVGVNSLLFMSLFPFSFFFGSMMTESLFLLTTAAACYYALSHKWLAFGLWGTLAAATRMTGLLVIVPAGIELLRHYRPLASPIRQSLQNCWKKVALRIPLVLLPLLGTGSYLLLNYRVSGNMFMFATQQKHWHQGFMPMPNVAGYLIDYFKMHSHDTDGFALWLPEVVLLVLFSAIFLLSVRDKKIPSSLLAYALVYLVATYSLSWLLSAGRYLSACFIFFILAAKLVEKKEMLQTMIISGEAVFLGIYLFAHMTGAQIM